MDVLRRDDFRCQICGCRAADYVDIELYAHHILPYGMGGLTEPDNLITLWHTCHCGLDPHFEVRLLGMVRGRTSPYEIDIDQIRGYEESVRFYRQRSVPEPDGILSPENLNYDLIVQIPVPLNSWPEEYDEERAINLWLHAQANLVRKYVRPHGCEDEASGAASRSARLDTGGSCPPIAVRRDVRRSANR